MPVQPAREVGEADSGRDRKHDRRVCAGEKRREGARGLPHLLRLHRENDERRAGHGFARAFAEEGEAGKARGNPRPRLRQRLHHPKIVDDASPREHPADERGRHVAAADERNCHVCWPPASVVQGAGCFLPDGSHHRAPKIEVPTRTSVAPSAMASSRSADIPIDSVSTGRPCARHSSKQSRRTRNCARRRRRRRWARECP